MNAQPGNLLRIYVNETDRWQDKPLYEAIVNRCRDLNVAGVTAFRALEGFGETAEMHRPHLFANQQPIVITIVERPEKALEIMPVLEEMMNSGLIAVTDVDVVVVSNGVPTALG